MKLRTIKNLGILLAACAAMGIAGCGGSSVGNVITVTVSPSQAVVLAGQVQSFTATVGGSTTLTVTWACTFSYTPAATTAVPNPKAVTGTCPTDGSYGSFTTTASPPVLVFTAPSLAKFPNPVPVLTFTATADADKKKTGTATVGLDSGIRVAVSPTSVTVPVGLNPAQSVSFDVSLLNAPPINLNWTVVQPDTASTTTNNQTANPLAATCSPTCGAIDANGKFTAPATLPTDTTPAGSKSTSPTTVFAVVNSNTDPNHFAVATITLISATTHPITFTGISPTVVAAGGVEQDIFLQATNLLNTTQITFTPPGTNQQPQAIDKTSTFTIPVSPSYCTASATGVTPVVTCDASILTRIRLNQAQLANAELDPANPAMITVSGIPDPNNSGATISKSFPLHLVYASPALVAAVPDSFPQGSSTTGSEILMNGGFFGGGSNPIVKMLFDGNLTTTTSDAPRQLRATLTGNQTSVPGLFAVGVQSNAIAQGAAMLPPFQLAQTNVAIQPNFQTAPTVTGNIPLPASGASTNLAPSSIALNSTKGYAVITEQATNTIQIVDISTGTPAMVGGPIAVGLAPTSIAIDDQLQIPGHPGEDLGVVVNSGDSTLSLVALKSGAQVGAIDLKGLIPEPPGTNPPTPFSVGVDPGTHRGVVAFTSTNIGFIVDFDPNDTTQKCFNAPPTTPPPCVVASVSLNTGFTPQVVLQPEAPFAYVTPGGGGVTSVVNLLQSNTIVNIALGSTTGTSGATRTNNVVKIITLTPHGINPAVGGTVLIEGVMPADLNGTYQVNPGSVLDPFSFSYTQQGTNVDETGGGGSVLYGNPYFTFNTTNTAVGAAINPVTRTFAFADYNQSSQQIGFIGTLDQTVTSLTLTAGSCNGCTPTPGGAPETGFRSVAWDPFTNVLVAFNPSENTGPDFPGNAISLINPGGPAATGTQSAYRIIAAIKTGQVGAGSYTPSGSTTAVNVFGPMTYDPKTHLVLVANAGSNNLTYMNLDTGNNFKKVQIQTLQVTTGGVANAQPVLGSGNVAVCNPTVIPTTMNQLNTCMPQGITVGKQAFVQVFGQGFQSASGALARLDTVSSAACAATIDPASFCTKVVSDSEVDVNIPATMLTMAHDYALDVGVGGVISNVSELHGVGVTDLTSACSTAPAQPEGVAIDDIRRVAVVTNFGCNNVSIVNLDTTNRYGKPYGAILFSTTPVSVGKNPIGVGVIPRLGFAVVANNGETPNGTATIIDLRPLDSMTPSTPVVVTWTPSGATTASNSVTVGLSPSGAAIDQDRAVALISNTGSNTLSAIDLTVLLPGAVTSTTPAAATVAVSGPPKAIAIDPNRAIAVVTNIQNSGTTGSSGGLDVINLAVTPPARSSTASISSITANPTGIAYDPAVSPALFYVTSTQQNAVYAFNPDSGSTQQIRVGINPFSIAYNYQTGAMLTLNSTSNTSSVIDSQNFKTRETLGISSQSQFAAAMDNLTNTAVIVDQNNNRVLFLAMPK